jgi:hypothetical protein
LEKIPRPIVLIAIPFIFAIKRSGCLALQNQQSQNARQRMDPDMVRQQAEEEAASRVLHSRGAPRPDIRIAPPLPAPVQFSKARFASGFEKMTPPPAPVMRPAWGMAFDIATSCAIVTAFGLLGGLMLAVKLQLVAWQGVGIGAAVGLALGWRLSSLTLLRRGGYGRKQAYAAGLKMALTVLSVMAFAMFVLPHFAGPQVGPSQPLDVMIFWKCAAVGGLASVILGAAMLRRAVRS